MGRDCTYCGAYVSDGLDACPACGKRLKSEKSREAEPYTSSYSSAGAYAYQQAEEYEQASREEKGTYHSGQNQQQPSGRSSARPESGRYSSRQEYREQYRSESEEDGPADPDDVRENRGISFLCYFGPLFLIPYLTRPNSDFVRFHSNQGLLLLLLDAICGFVGLGFAGGVFHIVCLVMGLSAVSKGEKRKLPIIGGIQLLR